MGFFLKENNDMFEVMQQSCNPQDVTFKRDNIK